MSTTRATGTFELTSTRHPPYDTAPGATLARTTFSKTFSDDLVATSIVEMLSAMSEVAGSAGYVALERVTGTLHGQSGSFVLQHSGTMTRSTPTLSLTVVPDSGSGELKTISGAMTIEIIEKQHHYTFTYSL